MNRNGRSLVVICIHFLVWLVIIIMYVCVMVKYRQAGSPINVELQGREYSLPDKRIEARRIGTPSTSRGRTLPAAAAAVCVPISPTVRVRQQYVLAVCAVYR